MAEREVRSIRTTLTAEDRARHQNLRQEIEQERPELIARGRRIKAKHARLREAIATLHAARQSLGLSLADIKERTGIEKSNLSRLENASNPNPTIETLMRYADAVGKEFEIHLIDKSTGT